MTVASVLAAREACLCVRGDLKQMTVASALALAVREACLCVRGDLKQMTVASVLALAVREACQRVYVCVEISNI